MQISRTDIIIKNYFDTIWGLTIKENIRCVKKMNIQKAI